MSKVSVVVPIYNAEKKLKKCIKSILVQTFREIEIILVNDGSTDNSLKICEKYQKLDNRISLIDKENEGSILTRKRGVYASKSDYVMFVDADDWIDKNTIKILYDEAINCNVDITVCNMYKAFGNIIKKKNNSYYFNDNKIYYRENIRNELVVAYFYGHPFPSSLCAKLYKKDLLLNSGKYLKRIKFLGDDLFYNLEMFIKANSVKVIEKPLYYYRVGGFTCRYMPYLFDDMISGYQIQKEVIDEFYSNSIEKQYKGICIMLLNTLKTCLYNLFISGLTESQIKSLIKSYISNFSIIESLENEGAKKYFTKEYLNAIRSHDIEYLFKLGENLYKKRKPKIIIFKFLGFQ